LVPLGATFAALLVWLLLSRTEQLQSSLRVFGDPGIAGIFGSLLGAIIGGMLTFTAAIYSQRNQTAARGAVVRKNTIYTPLYDELVSIRAMLEENPYPQLFELGSGRQTALPHPIFGAWERIKKDSRILQVPQYIANNLEEYTESVRTYLSLRYESARDVQEKMNQIYRREHNAEFEIKNIGDTMLASVILGVNPTRGGMNLRQEIALESQRDLMSAQPKQELTDQQINHLTQEIYNQCNELPSVKRLVEAYERSVSKLEDLIKALATIIEVINKKYERHRGWY
jgi:hypothetical protein